MVARFAWRSGYDGRDPVSREPLLLVDDPLFDDHRSRGYHPERPERLEAARKAIAQATAHGVATRRLEPRDATDDEIARAHTPAHVEHLRRLAGHWAAVDADTFVSPSSIAAARRAAGGAIALVEALLDPGASSRKGVALLRPPGHHATPDAAMGFCLVNNAAVAAHAALAAGLERVAIVDWDVHHGNGTQDIFWTDPRVLYVSLHQFPLYPGTGCAEEIGADEGRGFTVNVPLSASAADAVYDAAMRDVVAPVLERFAPELVLVSAGYDAHERDPLASMNLSDAGFASMASAVAKIADQTAKGRMALILEGGYDLGAIERSLAASIEAMLSPAEPPPASSRQIGATHRAEIERARRMSSETWRDL